MTKKGNYTCIRGLKDFKDGCPRRYGKYPEGCAAWRKQTLANGKSVSGCIDQLSELWAYDTIGMLVELRADIQSFRNNMTEKVGDKIVPKSSPIMEHVLCLMENANNAAILKRIDG